MTHELWRIEKLVPGGAGMARRADGSVGFAPGALPGDRIAVERLTQKKSYAEAREFRVLEPSAERVAPGCPNFERCGGCDWLHLAYDAQLRHKASLLAEALHRTGGFREHPEIRVVPSPRQSGYRSRIRLHIDDQGRFGFFAAASHRLVELEHCPAALPELNHAFTEFARIAREFPKLLAAFEQAELRASPLAPNFALRLVPRGDLQRASVAAEQLLTALRSVFSLSIAGISGDFAQRFPLSTTLSLEVPADAFVQVNWEVNLLLVQALGDGARTRGVRRFLDLYAGAGNFTLALAAAGLSGVSVEGHPSAARAARRSLEAYGFSKVEVHAADVRTALGALDPRAEPFDLAVLDPPRAGAAEILASLVALSPRTIAYCSCDPVTLSRDLQRLTKRGYVLEALSAFDMFPGTHHLEALAWLSRAPLRA
ncbi:MAG TPA: class I SAM-dependent RNA methyltransferase [Polyangiaceae bacterium]|nr:class I SAM-dependent RNA methyltransferase [Polyangiaceae bacterium]